MIRPLAAPHAPHVHGRERAVEFRVEFRVESCVHGRGGGVENDESVRWVHRGEFRDTRADDFGIARERVLREVRRVARHDRRHLARVRTIAIARDEKSARRLEVPPVPRRRGLRLDGEDEIVGRSSEREPAGERRGSTGETRSGGEGG